MTRPFRRRVFYIPGYDPFPPRRYRELYRREGGLQAAISGHRLTITPRQDRSGFGWGVDAVVEGRPVRAEFQVLVWDDIVQGSMGHGIAATYAQLARTAWAYIRSGALFRMMRLRRGPVIAALYPIAVLTLQLLLAAGIGWLAARIAALAHPALAVPAALVAALAVLVLFRRHDSRIFAYYLMHDYAFTADHGGGLPPALHDRIGVFADRIGQALLDDWDEVLVIGHSSGAALAVSVLADLTRRPLRQGPALSLLTLGHVVPMAALLPKADALRADLAWLGVQERPFWVDVTAPGDACCFALCDPVATATTAPPGQRAPLVISAAFSKTLSEKRLQALRWRWFARHFQYLCAFDKPGNYDYFAITAGPQTLQQRFGGRSHSPGRITTGPAG